LFALVNDLLRERAKYTSEDALSERLELFAAAALHPTNEYDVAFPIDAILLPDGEVEIGRTKFAHFDEARLQAWAGEIAEDSIVREQLLGRTVGLVRVSAGSPYKAFELAGLEVDTALALMRAAMASSGAIAPMDDLFWQRRSRFRVAKSLTDPTSLTFEFRNEFSGIVLDLRGSLKDGAEPLTNAARTMGVQVAPLFDGTVRKRLADALIRAAEWIGSSVTRESYDDKVVDLCAQRPAESGRPSMAGGRFSEFSDAR
jgi:hypothetical protein